MKLKIIFAFFFISPFVYAEPYPNETRIFNLVMRAAYLIPGVEFQHTSSTFDVMETNDIWLGVAIDGKSYKVSTLKYSYSGTISLNINESFYYGLGNCEIVDPKAQLFVGWTVMQPGITGTVYNSAGALYDKGFGGGVGVQTRWVGMPLGKPEFIATFSAPGLSAEVYVTDGPQGFYTKPGRSSPVYVHGAGARPNVIPYADLYGLSCGDHAYLSVGEPIPTEPIEPIEPDLVCNFWLDEDTLDLGVVDQNSAMKANRSGVISGQCNSDVIVNLEVLPQDMHMGGLTVSMSFDDNYWSAKKNNWQLDRDKVENSILWAQVSSIDTDLVPGNYSKSGIIKIEYE